MILNTFVPLITLRVNLQLSLAVLTVYTLIRLKLLLSVPNFCSNIY